MHNCLCLGHMACLDISPQYQVIFKDFDLKLTCNNVKGNPKWFKDGQSSIRRATYELNYLKIREVTEEDSGTYVCEGYDTTSYRLSRATSEVLVGCKFNYFSKVILLSLMEDQSPIK